MGAHQISIYVGEGKGDGVNLVLLGCTGTGKALTAETLAHELEAPLIHMTAGALGAAPNELEESLRNLFELAFAWSAILLIDEADAFLNRRDNDNSYRT
ncbi:hypothetical protein DM02DRAFT_395954 [Periconia macrospinosa]|uniref:ATPase AAA-type core domain-containing protein n=1 Tax=Periconia macrospinosa TaxID=97972 RepID=A0A2V1CYZ0_9PLEO|nr:hypothetical protein DM02DRAFT_395954 [Periconia macrospinosa]